MMVKPKMNNMDTQKQGTDGRGPQQVPTRKGGSKPSFRRCRLSTDFLAPPNQGFGQVASGEEQRTDGKGACHQARQKVRIGVEDGPSKHRPPLSRGRNSPPINGPKGEPQTKGSTDEAHAAGHLLRVG